MIRRLHIDAIHESFPRDLVIREENVVDVLNDMCSVAHRMALFQVFKSDDLAMSTVVEEVWDMRVPTRFWCCGHVSAIRPEVKIRIPLFEDCH